MNDANQDNADRREAEKIGRDAIAQKARREIADYEISRFEEDMVEALVGLM